MCYIMNMMLTQDKESIDQLLYMSALYRERQSEACVSDREREECKKSVKALARAVEILNTVIYA